MSTLLTLDDLEPSETDTPLSCAGTLVGIINEYQNRRKKPPEDEENLIQDLSKQYAHKSTEKYGLSVTENDLGLLLHQAEHVISEQESRFASNTYWWRSVYGAGLAIIGTVIASYITYKLGGDFAAAGTAAIFTAIGGAGAGVGVVGPRMAQYSKDKRIKKGLAHVVRTTEQAIIERSVNSVYLNAADSAREQNALALMVELDETPYTPDQIIRARSSTS